VASAQSPRALGSATRVSPETTSGLPTAQTKVEHAQRGGPASDACGKHCEFFSPPPPPLQSVSLVQASSFVRQAKLTRSPQPVLLTARPQAPDLQSASVVQVADAQTECGSREPIPLQTHAWSALQSLSLSQL
jgi:hypothetical protein